MKLCCSQSEVEDSYGNIKFEGAECDECCTEHAKPTFIVLEGTLSDGFRAYGPFKTESEAETEAYNVTNCCVLSMDRRMNQR